MYEKFIYDNLGHIAPCLLYYCCLEPGRCNGHGRHNRADKLFNGECGIYSD